MKLRKLIQRTTAAAVASAMALTIAMPALAETWDLSNAEYSDVDGILVDVDGTGTRYVKVHHASSEPDEWSAWAKETTETIITGSNAYAPYLEIDGEAVASVTLKDVTLGREGGSASSEATLDILGDTVLKLEGNNTVYGSDRGLNSYGKTTITGSGTLTTYGYDSYWGLEPGENVTMSGDAMLNIRDGFKDSILNNSASKVVLGDDYSGTVNYYDGDSNNAYLTLSGTGTPAVSYGITVTVNGTDIPVTENNKDDILSGQNITGKLSYNSESHILSSDERIQGTDSAATLKITIGDSTEAPVDVKLNGGVAVGSLEITGAQNVTASTNTPEQSLFSATSLAIECNGDLELVNNGNYSVASASTINFTSGGKMTLQSSGSSLVLGGSTVTLSSGGPLTLENSGTSYAVSCGTFTVENAGDISIKGGASGGSGTIKKCTGNVELSSSKNSAWSFGSTSITCNGSLKVNGSDTAGSTLFSGGSDTVLSCGGDLIIENTGSGQAMDTYQFTLKNAQNVKITGSTSSVLFQVGRSVSIHCTGNVEIENTGSGIVVGSDGFTIEGAANVAISGRSDSILILGGKAMNVSCTGNAAFENAGTGQLINSAAFSITSGGKMTFSGNTESDLNTGSMILNAGDDLILKNTGTGSIASCSSISLTSNGKIFVSGNSSSNSLLSGSTVTMKCGDDLTVENTGTSAVVSCGTFTVEHAKDVTLGALSCSNADITCSGRVTIAAAAETDAPAARGSLTYTQSDDKAYEVKAGTDSESAEVLPDVGEKGTPFTMTNKEYKYLCITPDGWTEPVEPGPVDPIEPTDPSDPGSGGNSGSAVGAVIAGAAIGGTVVWLGYEIVTDIILSDLLPKGAAVPANRGQLALLLWANADKPEPENQPAFTDVSDPETAKAAQWCVEQGYLDAADGSFRPDVWTPKFKTIEVWNKAFPKQ